MTTTLYDISTVAGDGTVLSGVGGAGVGDGGSPTNAAFNSPESVTVDQLGNLFVSDYGNLRIRKVDTNGVISTIAGNGHTQEVPGPGGNGQYVGGFSGDGGAATNAELNFPHGITVDGTGNLYIADENNERIREVFTNGVIMTLAGGGTNYPGDGGFATNASLSNPTGVAVDGAGNVFICDYWRILKVNPNGIITTVAGNGSNGFSGDGGAATNAELNAPQGIAVDGSGNLYIADTGSDRIREVMTNGIIMTVAGGGTNNTGDGALATNAVLLGPTGIAVDQTGNLFIADERNERIREVLTNGTIITVAGDGFQILTRVTLAGGIGFGYVYVGGYSGDGAAAITAELNWPEGIALDGAGNLLMADTRNGRIRKATRYFGPTLTLLNVTTNNSGNYQVIVSSTFGSVTSSVAHLTVVPPPSCSILKNDGVAQLAWGAVSGLVYQVQYATNLVTPNWLNFGNAIMATNSVITIPDSATNSQRLYRVSILP
jgi:sugar lactone lactonase YvrE